MTHAERKQIRHWWINKSINSNIAIDVEFCEFQPTVHVNNFEWIKVYSADDLQKTIGMGLTRYSEVMTKVKKLTQALEDAKEQFALMADGEGNDHRVYMQMSKFAYEEARKALEVIK